MEDRGVLGGSRGLKARTWSPVLLCPPHPTGFLDVGASCPVEDSYITPALQDLYESFKVDIVILVLI